jgi:hypothetical protein
MEDDSKTFLNWYHNYSNPCRSRKFFTPPQPSPYKGEGVKNSQMI